MKQLTIGFSKPKNKMFPIGSWLIKLYNRTEYSHVYLEFYSETINRNLVYEAVGDGVRFIGSKSWSKHAQEVKSYTINVDKCNHDKAMQECVDHEGEDYGYMQNIGVFISNIFGWKENLWKKGKNCAEIIGDLLAIEGYEISKDHNLLTPWDIEQILKKGKKSK